MMERGFSDVTSQGSDRFSFGMGHSVADYNGDGNLDIHMVGWGPLQLRLEGMKLGRKGFESIQDARMKMDTAIGCCWAMVLVNISKRHSMIR